MLGFLTEWTVSILHCTNKSQLLITRIFIWTYSFPEEISFFFGISYMRSIFQTNCSTLFVLRLLNGCLFFIFILKVRVHARKHFFITQPFHHQAIDKVFKLQKQSSSIDDKTHIFHHWFIEQTTLQYAFANHVYTIFWLSKNWR